MRKNGSRLISFKQYKFTDLFLFAVILVVADLVAHFAPLAMPGAADFVFVLTLPIIISVMIRWGWVSVFFAVGDGILQSLLNNIGVWRSYLSYSIGNCFILVLLLAIKYIGVEKIVGKWYFSVLFVISGWLLQALGITLMMFITNGGNFLIYLVNNMGFGLTGFMSLAAAIVVILILRRLDGMLENQKHYLLRLDEERKEKARRDEFGDEPIEIDEDTLSILRKSEDEFKK